MSAEGAVLNIKEIITKKRDGKPLQSNEVDYIVRAITDGKLHREQIGALLMAIWIRGMNVDETIRLTYAMVHSGETLEWPEEWRGLVADKHSTGGVGDKVSLVLTPALAACGLKVPMISGRGLAHTGGTLDKLEAIPGFCVSQSSQNIQRLLKEVGCCIVGQTEAIVPADKILYSSRDVTCTIDSLPLIVSSIVSKKVAENLSSLVLDVKFGRAAFMQDKKDARELAQSMVDVSNGLGIKTTALLTSMHNPLGYHVGNALEVFESLRCMHGEGPADLEDLVVMEGALLLRSLGKVTDLDAGRQRLRDVIHNGEALEKFRQMALGQGVSAEDAQKLCRRGEEFAVMTEAKHTTKILAQSSGHVHGIEPMSIALSSASLGGARFGHDDKINHAVGVVFNCLPGQHVNEGDVLATVHHDTPTLEQSLVNKLTGAVEIKKEIPEKFHRIADIIE